MPNPMLSQLNKSRAIPIKDMANLVKNAQNPQAMLNQLIRQNPQINEAMEYINANGGDAKKAFYSMAREKGIDPESILSQLR